MSETVGRPGSKGEHELQDRYNSAKRAAAFYDNQMLDRLNEQMKEFIARQEMAFIATSDAHGECDATFRAGPAGFMRVLDDRTLIYPEYRGNGVMASMGNIAENGHIGILFVDFFESTVGLHVNGKAKVVEDHVVNAMQSLLERLAGVEKLHDGAAGPKKTPERWVMVEVEEAYIHCSKNIPLLARRDKADAQETKSGDHFAAKNEERPWAAREAVRQAAEAVAAAAAGEAPEQPAEQPVAAAAAPQPEPQLEPQPQPDQQPEPVAVEPAAEPAGEACWRKLSVSR